MIYYPATHTHTHTYTHSVHSPEVKGERVSEERVEDTQEEFRGLVMCNNGDNRFKFAVSFVQTLARALFPEVPMLALLHPPALGCTPNHTLAVL